jgi:hypothetical protein
MLRKKRRANGIGLHNITAFSSASSFTIFCFSKLARFRFFYLQGKVAFIENLKPLKDQNDDTAMHKLKASVHLRSYNDTMDVVVACSVII